MISAIPTTYKGIRFRSRLEATWATFFDLVGWSWEYEPIDLKGYIPDFILTFTKPILVEVKPALYLKELKSNQQKIDENGWEHEALLVGACLFNANWSGSCLGLLKEKLSPDDWDWSGAIFQKCGKCKKFSFFHEEWTFNCRVNNCYEGDHYIYPVSADDFWTKAKNSVQWKR